MAKRETSQRINHKIRWQRLTEIILIIIGICFFGWVIGLVITSAVYSHSQEKRIALLQHDFMFNIDDAYHSVKFRQHFVDVISHASDAIYCTTAIRDEIDELRQIDNKNQRIAKHNISIDGDISEREEIINKYNGILKKQCK